MKRRFGFETLESRQLLAAAIVEHDGIGYAFSESVPRVDRYDIAAEAWLAPLTLEGRIGGASVAHVDDDGIFVADDMQLHRYSLTGENSRLVRVLDRNVTSIVADGHLLFVALDNGPVNLLSIDKNTNALIDSFFPQVYMLDGLSIAPSINRIFGHSFGSSPEDIAYYRYRDDGTFAGSRDSPYHGDVSNGSKTWVLHLGKTVVDDRGVLFSTSDLSSTRGLASKVTDLAITHEGETIVLSESTLTRYSLKFLPEAGAVLDAPGSDVVVGDSKAIVFHPDLTQASGFRVSVVPFTSLKPPKPAKAFSPVELVYTPDQVEVTNDGTVLLLSKERQNIFRWNSTTQSYGETIPLVGSPESMTYSSATNTLYLTYATRLIRQLNLNDPTPRETPFLGITNQTPGVLATGPYLLVPSMRATYGPDGKMVERADWDRVGFENVWSEVKQRVYYIDPTSTPNVYWGEINADGATYPGEAPGGLRNKQGTPFHGNLNLGGPVFISPDGNLVVLGSGTILDGDTLELSDFRFSTASRDVAWVGDRVYALNSTPDTTVVERRSSLTYLLEDRYQRYGKPNALVELSGNRLLLITVTHRGVPQFVVLDSEFRPQKFLPGDVDYDGSVDARDFQIVREGFGSPGLGDSDGDNDVDVADWQAVRQYFGATVDNMPLLQNVRSTDATKTSRSSEGFESALRGDLASTSSAAAVRSSIAVSVADVVFDQLSRESTATTFGSLPRQQRRAKLSGSLS